MKFSFKIISIPAITTSALLGAQAHGEESTLTIGSALMLSSSSYQKGKSVDTLIPLIEGYWDNLFISGDRAGGFIAGDDDWALAIVIGIGRTSDAKRGDSPTLKDMPSLNDVTVGGFTLFTEKISGEYSLDVAHDISGNHNGYTAELMYRYPIRAGAWTIYPELMGRWMSHEVSEYYYGVSRENSRVDRPYYRPGPAYQCHIGVSAEFSIDRHHTIDYGMGYRRLSDNIRESSIIKRAYTSHYTIGYTYTF